MVSAEGRKYGNNRKIYTSHNISTSFGLTYSLPFLQTHEIALNLLHTNECTVILYYFKIFTLKHISTVQNFISLNLKEKSMRYAFFKE